MKKSILMIILILIIIAVGWVWQNRFLDIIYKEASTSIEKISANITDKNYTAARSEFDKFSKNWTKNADTLSLIVSHEDIDSITMCNARLRASINDEGETEALAVIGELYEIFKEVDEKFKVNLKTIL